MLYAGYIGQYIMVMYINTCFVLYSWKDDIEQVKHNSKKLWKVNSHWK